MLIGLFNKSYTGHPPYMDGADNIPVYWLLINASQINMIIVHTLGPLKIELSPPKINIY